MVSPLLNGVFDLNVLILTRNTVSAGTLLELHNCLARYFNIRLDTCVGNCINLYL